MTEHAPWWLVTLTPHSRQSLKRRTTKMRRMMRPRWPRDLDASARPTRDRAEENIGRSATSGPRVKRVRLPLLLPNLDSGTGAETAWRAFATLLGQFALATSTAAITAFLIFWTFTTEWTHGPSTRTADGDSTEPRLIGPTQ